MKHLFMLLITLACSSHELSDREWDQGEYQFNLQLKKAYTQFFQQKVFHKGSQAFAGPGFVDFMNGQPLILLSLAPIDSLNDSYQAKDGSRHEYTKHLLKMNHQEKYVLRFRASFQSLEEVKSIELLVETSIKCRPELKCSMKHFADVVKFQDPYEYEFNLNPDYLSSQALDLKEFSESEVTAIRGRYIYRGMGQKASELAIGKNTHYLHGFYNVTFENSMVKNFDFRFTHDLPLFSNH